MSRGLLNGNGTDINTTRLFIHMLLKANWKDENFKGTTVSRDHLFCPSGKACAKLTYGARNCCPISRSVSPVSPASFPMDETNDPRETVVPLKFPSFQLAFNSMWMNSRVVLISVYHSHSSNPGSILCSCHPTDHPVSSP